VEGTVYGSVWLGREGDEGEGGWRIGLVGGWRGDEWGCVDVYDGDEGIAGRR